MWVVAGIAALVVVILFFFGRTGPGPSMEQAGSAGAPDEHPAEHAMTPVPPAFAAQVAELEEAIEAAEGEERLARQRELVNLFVGMGRPDRAAVVQEEIARQVDTPDAWARAGNLFYDWIDGVDDAHRSAVARRAIAAYLNVLAVEPDNLDVRTNLAVAYLYDPDDPMQAIEHTNYVLERDPDHIPANFNRGLMMLQINRVEEGVQQMEKVKRLAGEGTPFYRQADEVIRVVREARTGR
jgi:tetratricopeptide (TPR) repeat protein